MTTLAVGSIAVTTDGTGNFELVDFDPGAVERDNWIAESRRRDGAILTGSRIRTTQATLSVRCAGIANAQALAAELDGAGTGCTITETVGGSSLSYECFPASVSIKRDSILESVDLFLLTALIPRQP